LSACGDFNADELVTFAIAKGREVDFRQRIVRMHRNERTGRGGAEGAAREQNRQRTFEAQRIDHGFGRRVGQG
jgi:hypothetical protein